MLRPRTKRIRSAACRVHNLRGRGRPCPRRWCRGWGAAADIILARRTARRASSTSVAIGSARGVAALRESLAG